MGVFLQKVTKYFEHDIWTADINSRSKGLFFRALRLSYAISKDFMSGDLSLRAASLAFITILSLVPFLALSFSILKAFNAQTSYEIMLYYFLEPIGPKGVDLSMKIIGFVENASAGILGVIGFIALFYMVSTKIKKVEDTLNHMWHVGNPRSFSQKFNTYLGVLVIGPVVVMTALGLNASFIGSGFLQKYFSARFLGEVRHVLTIGVPFLVSCTAITFIYIMLPNTKVKIRPAIAGGIVFTALWHGAGIVFSNFIVKSAKYSAIYSGFALLILLPIWLYWSWIVFLLGSRITFYIQYPQFLDPRAEPLLESSGLQEKCALLIMVLIGVNFKRDLPAWDFSALVGKLGIPADIVKRVLNMLEKDSLIVQSRQEPSVYLPGKDLGIISAREVINAVRQKAPAGIYTEKGILSFPEIDRIYMDMEKTISASLENVTIQDLVAAIQEK